MEKQKSWAVSEIQQEVTSSGGPFESMELTEELTHKIPTDSVGLF